MYQLLLLLISLLHDNNLSEIPALEEKKKMGKYYISVCAGCFHGHSKEVHSP